MTGIKIDGKIVAQSVRDRVKRAVDELKSQGINPCLATVLVGDDPASTTYVKNKRDSTYFEHFVYLVTSLTFLVILLKTYQKPWKVTKKTNNSIDHGSKTYQKTWKVTKKN